MALTQLQARDTYIFDSIGQFLDRNIKQAYDVEVLPTQFNVSAGLQYPKPLTIRAGKSDDVSLVRAAPSIAISKMPSGENERCYELGSAKIWRHRAYLFSCYPSLDATGAPCDWAHNILRSYMQDAFETECIKIIDYSNPSCTASNIIYASDDMYIVRVSDPIDRGQTTALAEEKHRFDVHLMVKFCVLAVLAT